MTCEHTKKQRIKWIGAKPSEIRTLEDRRLVFAHPELLRDRIEVSEPMIICGDERPAIECQVHLCGETATHECDGCDLPICRAHATRKGTQWIETDTGFVSPGWSRMAIEDSLDFCPFCIFNGADRRSPRARGTK